MFHLDFHLSFFRFGVSLEFHLGLLFRVSFKGFLSGCLIRISKRPCGFLWGFFRVSSRVSFSVSLGFHVGFL